MLVCRGSAPPTSACIAIARAETPAFCARLAAEPNAAMQLLVSEAARCGAGRCGSATRKSRPFHVRFLCAHAQQMTCASVVSERNGHIMPVERAHGHLAGSAESGSERAPNWHFILAGQRKNKRARSNCWPSRPGLPARRPMTASGPMNGIVEYLAKCLPDADARSVVMQNHRTDFGICFVARCSLPHW